MKSSSILALLTLLVATAAQTAMGQGVQPIIDNERVEVWDTTSALPPAQHEFVAVSLSGNGGAVLGHKDEIPGEAGAHTVVIELKDHPVAPIPNHSGYPNAFPRPHVTKLLEDKRVIVWSYHWKPGEPTPMHFHDKDLVVVYTQDIDLKSTAPDGKSVTTEHKSGDVQFNPRGRTHTETLVKGSGSAIITELK